MPGRAFRSILEPFYEHIVKERRAGKTWEEIAAHVRKKTKRSCSRQAVQDYFKRRRKKKPRVLMGMEPVEAEPVSPPQAARAPVIHPAPPGKQPKQDYVIQRPEEDEDPWSTK